MRHKMASFQPCAILTIATTIPQVGGAQNILASVEQWLMNYYTWFQTCSYCSLEVMLDQKADTITLAIDMFWNEMQMSQSLHVT